MKICYVWVEKYRNFENFGFNISSSCKFTYNSQNNFLSKNDVPQLPKDFFGDRITDVVGIIGKNGAGKSNAIELVCKSLKGGRKSLQTDFFVIIEKQEKLICYYSFSKRFKPVADFDIEFEEYIDVINPLKVVYFSNVFDERINGFDKEVSDISVNNLFSRNFQHEKKDITDFEKQIRLINSRIFSRVNIDLPTHVLFTSKVWSSRIFVPAERILYGSASDVIRQLRQIFRDRLREIKPENKFIPLLRFGLFLEISSKHLKRSVFNDSLSSSLVDKISDYIPSLFRLRTEEISEKLIEFLESDFLRFFPSQPQMFDDDLPSVEPIINKQIRFLKDLKSSLDDIKFEYDTEGNRNREVEYFKFKYDSKKSRRFIADYVTLFGESNIFTINWLGISSGHRAYLNLFASLHQELRFTRQENLLLCIDEGDLYLHPMWQIEFFDKLLDILPSIFPGNIQLVLTSHSPFLLSDLPKQNITILDKNVWGFSQDGTILKINTFGANLYDLYSEPFFLGQKRISDFAYRKIKDLIYSVENKKLSRKDKRELLLVANLIGDEVIQYRIKKILNDD